MCWTGGGHVGTVVPTFMANTQARKGSVDDDDDDMPPASQRHPCCHTQVLYTGRVLARSLVGACAWARYPWGSVAKGHCAGARPFGVLSLPIRGTFALFEIRYFLGESGDMVNRLNRALFAAFLLQGAWGQGDGPGTITEVSYRGGDNPVLEVPRYGLRPVRAVWAKF